jgi:O-antigen/teichoic acid export membrane protein
VGSTSLIANLLLIPKFGLKGAGYAYIVEIFWSFIALIYVHKHFLSKASVQPFFSAVAIPNVLGLFALCGGAVIRNFLNDPGWIGFFVLGVSIAVSTALLILAMDRFLLGNDSHTKMLHGFSRRIASISMNL